MNGFKNALCNVPGLNFLLSHRFLMVPTDSFSYSSKLKKTFLCVLIVIVRYQEIASIIVFHFQIVLACERTLYLPAGTQELTVQFG